MDTTKSISSASSRLHAVEFVALFSVLALAFPPTVAIVLSMAAAVILAKS